MGPFEETAISKVVMGCTETTGASIQRAMMVDLIGLMMSVEVTLIKLHQGTAAWALDGGANEGTIDTDGVRLSAAAVRLPVQTLISSVARIIFQGHIAHAVYTCGEVIEVFYVLLNLDVLAMVGPFKGEG